MASTEASGAPAMSGTNWERASEWLTGICVVTFDLELGQALEVGKESRARAAKKQKLSLQLIPDLHFIS